MDNTASDVIARHFSRDFPGVTTEADTLQPKRELSLQQCRTTNSGRPAEAAAAVGRCGARCADCITVRRVGPEV